MVATPRKMTVDGSPVVVLDDTKENVEGTKFRVQVFTTHFEDAIKRLEK